jgi:phage terminase Nu1 subunit (DNA packaging protein)
MNASAFAKLCGVSKAQVTNWCDAGMPCIRRRGCETRISFRDAVRWVVQQRLAQPEGDVAALRREQTTKVQIANARELDSLLPADLVRAQMQQVIEYLAQALAPVAANLVVDDETRGRVIKELALATEHFAVNLESLLQPKPKCH